MHYLMLTLAQRRRVFHSEADFQHALAWQIHQSYPDCEIRLEFPIQVGESRIYVDIWLPTEGVAIELKYCTRFLEVTQNGERFELRQQGAYPVRRKDYVQDIHRLEQLRAKHREFRAGYAVLLTNDHLFWQPPRSPETVDAQFQIFDGRVITGPLAWASHAGSGTTKGRKEPVQIEGAYTMQWMGYSNLDAHEDGNFRYLTLTVQ